MEMLMTLFSFISYMTREDREHGNYNERSPKERDKQGGIKCLQFAFCADIPKLGIQWKSALNTFECLCCLLQIKH